MAIAASMVPAPNFAAADTEIIQNTREPLFVDATVGRLAEFLDLDSASGNARVQLIAQKLRAKAQEQPGRVATLRFTDLRWRYDRLPRADRQAVRIAAGSEDPTAWYAERVVERLQQILTAARADAAPMMLSVYGLPLESTGESEAQASAMKKAFGPVVSSLEALVVARPMLLSGSVAKRELTLSRGLPAAFEQSGGRPIFYRSGRDWQFVVHMDKPLNPAPETATPPPQPPASEEDGGVAQVTNLVAQLIAVWGYNDPTWDLNDDGVVGIADLLLLLGNWEAYNSGNPPSNEEPDHMGAFGQTPAEYTIGSDLDLTFELTSAAPPNANVVFQVWSDVTESIEAAYPLYEPPFVYPAELLAQVTPGGADVQALIRNQNNQVQETVRFSSVFIEGEQEAEPPTGGEGEETPPDNGGDGSSNPPGGGGSGGDGGSGGSGGDNSPPTNPDAPQPTVVITAMSTSGQAPFTFHAHGLGSSVGVGDVLTARFDWDFGDSTTDAQYNQLAGWNAAHVYDTPGTYTARLRITNQQGGQSSATVQVTVQPSTRNVIYVSTTGNDSNPGTQNQPIRTFAKAATMVNHNTEILFKRAGTYDVSSPMNIERANVVIGAWGNGAVPTLNWTSGGATYSPIIQLGSTALNVTIQDLRFDSPATSIDPSIVRGVHPAGRQVTVRRCHFDDVGYAMNTEADVFGFLTLNNTADVIGAYFVWGEGEDHVHLGNTVAGSTTEHNIRYGGVKRSLVACNDLKNTTKMTIWCMLGSYAYIANNTFRNGRTNIGPNGGVGSPSERFTWAVMDGNHMIDERFVLDPGAEHVMLRNNVIQRNGDGCIVVTGYSSSMNRTTKDIRIVHNTGINQSTIGRFVAIGAGTAETLIANNLYMSRLLETGAYQSANAYVIDGNMNGLEFKGNLWSNPNVVGWGNGWHYYWPNWANDQGYKNPTEWDAEPKVANESYRSFGANDLSSTFEPQFNANLSNVIPGVLTDRYGNPRPLSGLVTAGAVQK